MLNKDGIKNSLTVEAVIEVLKSLGASVPIKTDDGLIFETICHNLPGHGSKKLYYYSESKLFHCYTQCGDTFDIYELIIRNYRTRNIILSFPDAVRYVADKTGQAFSSTPSVEYIDDWQFINQITRTYQKPNQIQPINTNFLETLIPAPHIWSDEGITPEAAQKFGIGFYLPDNRIAIPHYDSDGNLIGIRGRSISTEEIDAGYKYMPLQIGNDYLSYPMMYNLYGLNWNQKTIERTKKVVLFEGEKSVIKAEVFYPDNNFTLALCSSNITDFQRDIILDLEVDEVMLALDKEYENLSSIEAKKYEKKILKLAAKFVPYMRTFVLWDTKSLLQKKDSPVDRGQKVLEQLMKEKVEVTTQMITRMKED